MAHTHNVLDDDIVFSIDPETRLIETELPLSLIQGDHNSERYTFEIPRYVDGHDMTLCNRVEIHFINIGSIGRNSDVYVVKDLKVDPEDKDYLIFSWLVSRAATSFAGSLNFVVSFKCLTGEVLDYAWHTAIFTSIKVFDSISADEVIVENYIDILESWRADVAKLESRIGDFDKLSNALVGTASGEVIRVDDVSPVEHTVRVIAKSKNLIPRPYYSHQTSLLDGITYTIDSDGKITLSGTTEKGTNFYLARNFAIKAGRYTLSGCSNLAGMIMLIYSPSDSLMVAQLNSGVGAVTFSVEKDLPNCNIYLNCSTANVAVSGYVYPMLEEGDTATEYTPYVDVSTAIVSRCGKNLLDITKSELIVVGSSGAKRYGVVFDKIGTFTLSGSAPVGIAVKLVTDGVYGDFTTLTGNVSYTFTLSSNEHLIIYQGSDGALLTSTLLNGQIEVGDTATDYEPYTVETYAPAADGTVSGVTSLAPTMTLVTDTLGVIIDVEYNADVNTLSEPLNELRQNFGISTLREDIEYNYDSIRDLEDTLANSGGSLTTIYWPEVQDNEYVVANGEYCVAFCDSNGDTRGIDPSSGVLRYLGFIDRVLLCGFGDKETVEYSNNLDENGVAVSFKNINVEHGGDYKVLKFRELPCPCGPVALIIEVIY